MSSVVNIRVAALRPRGYKSLQEWLDASPRHVYIGRQCQYVPGALGSIWQNPFSVEKYGREECLRKYEAYLRGRTDLMARLEELRGCELGCFCAPEPCHGNVILKLLEESTK